MPLGAAFGLVGRVWGSPPPAPSSFVELFGAYDEFRWGHNYTYNASDDAVWANEASPGWDANVWTPPSPDTAPLLGLLNGSPFPWYIGLEYPGNPIDGLKTADSFTGVDNAVEATFYGSFSTLAIADGGDSCVLMAQDGNFRVYLNWSGDDRFHLYASIQGGEQWNIDLGTIVDDSLIHDWVLVFRNDGTAKLFLDGVQIGPEATGIPAMGPSNVNGVYFGQTLFQSHTGGLYLNGIATRGITDVEVGYLFDIIAAYRGTATAPNVTGTTPGSANAGDTISVNGTGFVNGARVYFRENSGGNWELGDNITFVSSTQIDVDVPSALSDGLSDVMVINPTALYKNGAGVFTKSTGAAPTISSVDVDQIDTLGGELIPVHGSGFLTATSVAIGTSPSNNFYIVSDSLLYALAPALATAGSWGVVVTNPDGDSNTATIYTWDPTVEASCGTLAEFGDYGVDLGANGLGWAARKGPAVYEQNAGVIYTPLDDQGKEPRCISADSRTLHDSTNSLEHDFDPAGDDMSVGTFALGYRTPDAGTAGANAYQDPVPLLHHQGGGLTWATGHSDDGFGIAAYDGAWHTVRGACGVDQLNVGIARWDTSVIEARANGGGWASDGTFTGAQNAGLGTFLGADYGASTYSNLNVRFMMMANTKWDDTLCGKLDTWVKNRHGGKNDAGSGVVEIWYVSSDVLPCLVTPKAVTIKGKGFTGIDTVLLASTGGGIYAATSVVVVDDNTITCVPQSAGAFQGPAALIVTGPGLFAQQVNAVEYYDVLGRAAEVRYRVGDVGSRTDDTVHISALANTGVADGGSRDLQGNGTAGHVFSTGEDPQLFAADYDFGGEDAAGQKDGTGRAFTTPGNYTTPLAQPSTVYMVLVVEDEPQTFWAIGNGGSSAGAFSMYGTSDGLAHPMTVDNGGTGIQLAFPDATSCIAAAAYDGTNSRATVDDWLRATYGSTAGGSNQETSFGIGDYGVAAAEVWKMAARIVVSGNDDYPTWRKMIRALSNFFQLGRFNPAQRALLLIEPGQYNAGTPLWTATVGPNGDGSLGGATPAATGANDPDFNADSALGLAGGYPGNSVVTYFDPDPPVYSGGTGGWSGFAALTPQSANASAANPWDNDHVWGDDGGGYLGVTLRDVGGALQMNFWIWNGIAAVETALVTVTTGVRCVVHWRYYIDDAVPGFPTGYIQFGVNGTWGAQVPITRYLDGFSGAQPVKFGANYDGTKQTNAPLHAIGFYSRIKDDTFVNALVARYG